MQNTAPCTVAPLIVSVGDIKKGVIGKGRGRTGFSIASTVTELENDDTGLLDGDTKQNINQISFKLNERRQIGQLARMCRGERVRRCRVHLCQRWRRRSHLALTEAG